MKIILFFFADTNFHPDAFAALSGTLTAGGIMLWLCPYQKDEVDDLFIQRMLNQVFADAKVYVMSESDKRPPQLEAFDRPRIPDVSYDLGCQTLEQLQAVHAIEKVATGHRKRPLVLTADRGRGKSSALAIAVARLLQTEVQEEKIVITAPHKQALDIFFKQLKSSCPEGVYCDASFSYKGKNVVYLPVDVLIKDAPKTSLLLVDEAAAIPVYLLTQLVCNYHRMVFSTTIHGYEGAGRGFAVKFIKKLQLICPKFKKLHLTQPIRWAEHDALEQLTFSAFLLNASSNLNEQDCQLPALSQYETALVSQSQLFENEALLRQVFSILVNAHYQTSPSDLKLLLTNANVRLFVTQVNQKVVAVALCLLEGEASNEQKMQVAQSRRRLKDQFLPQSLFLHCGIEDAFEYSFLRIMRIAVHPYCQKQGVGSALLADIEAYVLASDIDCLGTSFGTNVELLSFWLKANYNITRIGFNCDKASGEHSALLLKAVSARASGLVNNANEQFYRSFSYLLTEQYKELPVELVQLVIAKWSQHALPQIKEYDYKAVNDFVGNVRLYDPCAYSLHVYLINQLANSNIEGSKCLISRLLQKHSIEEVCHKYELSGKKALNIYLKECFGQLLEADDRAQK